MDYLTELVRHAVVYYLADGVLLARRELDDVEGTFDLSMFHHSVESVPDPVAGLKSARPSRLTTPLVATSLRGSSSGPETPGGPGRGRLSPILLGCLPALPPPMCPPT